MDVKERVKNPKKHELNTKWSQTFYNANIPMISIVHHHVLIEAIKTTNEVRILYRPPTYYGMYKISLDDARHNTQELIEDKMIHPQI